MLIALTFSSFIFSFAKNVFISSYLNGRTFLSLIASKILYVCSLSPNNCSVVLPTFFLLENSLAICFGFDVAKIAFLAKIGVPVKPKILYFLKCL